MRVRRVLGYGLAMDDDQALEVLQTTSAALAGTAARDPERDVPTYRTWSVADLIVHTGRIHRWVTWIVANRATERPPQPEVARPADLLEWFREGATDAVDTMAAVSPTATVWTLTGDGVVGFWRRRLALETTIHLWDAQRAFGAAEPIPDGIAAAGVSEALEVYLEPRLRGAEIGGAGEVVRLRDTGGTRSWAVRLHSDAIEVVNADQPADVDIAASAADLWLFLMGRAGRDVLVVHGPPAVAARLEHAVALLPPPSR